ncbi:hypothetical protein AB0F91_26205 [Amycolatopsis sp. NPDC023774]|uniref:hypothetical protein n=1 Tax=Amycolatopsis sp. NPDC023774 TaxID=3155015 RepID=UPI0033D934E2
MLEGTPSPFSPAFVRGFEEVTKKGEDWKFRPVAERARIVARATRILREKSKWARSPVSVIWKWIWSADILDYCAQNGERFLSAGGLPAEPGATVVAESIGFGRELIRVVEPREPLPCAPDRARGPRRWAQPVASISR